MTETPPVVEVRYGVFLTPDAATCAAVTAVTSCIRGLYGFVSAGAFPPHATLAGSLPVGRPEAELRAALDAALLGRSAVPVHNLGVRTLGDVVVYDVNERDGRPNAGIQELARAIDAAVRPLLIPSGGLTADTFEEERFHAHLSLASHELFARPDLRVEVAAFARELPVAFPESFSGDIVTLYRFWHPTWSGSWWQAMRWEHVQRWRLQGPADGISAA